LAVEQTAAGTSHTYEVLEAVGGVMDAMVDQETGLRGYLITANKDNLGPFESGKANRGKFFQKAKALTSDNAEQQKRLDALDATIVDWREHVAEVAIGLMADAGTQEAARDLERKGAGKKYFDGIRGMVAEIDGVERGLLTTRSQALEDSLSAITLAIVLGALIMIVVAVALVMLITKLVVSPIQQITSTMGKLAGGDLSADVAMVERGDEVGSIARAVQVFKTGLVDAEKLRVEQRTAQAEKEKRQGAVDAAIRTFEIEIGNVVRTVSSASTELETSARALSQSAASTQERSNLVAAASEQTSVNVQGVAAASEELASTVREIGRQVEESRNISQQAVNQAARSNTSITQLSTSAERIGDVVGLINSIASQTNLLALNATIEAARAGDAGKGFAVVAQEVKALADQTAKATNEIATQVSSIQSATNDAVKAIQDISNTIGRMSEISGCIAAAVEQQSATTQEISRNVMEAAKGSGEVAGSIVDVSRAATETGSASGQVLSSAQQLNGESHTLRTNVDTFLTAVRAA
jgi:methyl-accepting chemotaxis protein